MESTGHNRSYWVAVSNETLKPGQITRKNNSCLVTMHLTRGFEDFLTKKECTTKKSTLTSKIRLRTDYIQ